MGIFETLYLVPLHFKLFSAMLSDLLGRGAIVNTLTVKENGLLKLNCLKILKRL